MVRQVRFETVDESSDDQRLDNYLIKILKSAPKSLIYRIIRKGEVRVNKGRAKPDTRLKVGDIVRVPPIKLSESTVQHKPGQGLIRQLDSAIVYESAKLLIVNKPSGLAVHGGSGVKLGLIEALRARPDAPSYLELVHRLDKDTSGCIMVAKKRSMLTYLQDLLREEGAINKRYLALVHGRWPKRKQLIDQALYKREAIGGERIVEANDQQGKASRTVFNIVEAFSDATLVEAKPLTGRTHQIRVHAKYAGHPLIGDDKYGEEDVNRVFRKRGIKRLFLHAHALELMLPDGDELKVNAPLPKDLQAALEHLRA